MTSNLVLISTLIVLFSLGSCHATIKSWYAKTSNSNEYIAKTQSNPRSDLESTPQDKAFLLVGVAETNVRIIVAFIDENTKSVQYKDVLDWLEKCKRGFNSIKSNLKLDRSKLDTPPGRSDVINKLNHVEKEVTDNCGWRQLSHDPVVKDLIDRVHSFSDRVKAAVDILKSIDH